MPDFLTGHLRCTPDCRDWGALGQIDVFSEAIIGGALYEVRAVDCALDLTDPSNFTAPLTLSTSARGDVAGPFAGGWTPPDGSVDIPFDLVAILDKFTGLPTGPRKARVDLVDNCLNLVIDILDISEGVDAFRELPYRFGPTSPDPCTALCP